MCGITGLIKKNNNNNKNNINTNYENIEKSLKSVLIRGQDRQKHINFVNKNASIDLGFARLAIMDKSENGDQPFIHNDLYSISYCMCNGEIYDFERIKKKYDIKTMSLSDCDIILPLYKKICKNKDIYQDTHQNTDQNTDNEKIFLDELKNNEFAFCVIDILQDDINILLATDPCSIRPIFYCVTSDYVAFSSILDGILKIVPDEHHRNITRLEGGHYISGSINTVLKKYKYYNGFDICPIINNEICDNIFDSDYAKNRMEILKNIFIEIVNNMMCSDRPLGALLSGGLDSSLVVAIAADYMKKQGKKLYTFSIGLPDGTDEKYAKIVSDHCETIHKHIIMSNDDFINAIPDVIKITETFDITTIRASTGQYLISKWIADNTDIKVLFIGDGSDELFSGYMYFHNCPNEFESHNENIRLLKNIHLYDGLRADRCIAGNNIEARLPFLNYKLIEFVLGTDPRLRYPNKKIEKWFLRKAFEQTNLLPFEILWRKKEAFSDGVSSKEKSWYELIQENINLCYPDEFGDMIKDYMDMSTCPKSKEALHYRLLFENYFGKNVDHVIPEYWLPKWSGDMFEPSARVLNVYHKN